MTDDAALLRRYLETHTEAAFTELVQRHVDLVYGAAWRQLNGDARGAEDVTQTVFVRLMRKARTLTDRTDLAGWLHTTARLVAREFVRSEIRRRRREREAQLMQESSASDTSEADWEQLRPVIDDAIGELSDSDRSAILARFFDGRKFAEIGAMLRLTEDAARMRVDRAVEKLRLVLARRGITSTSAALAVALTNSAIAAPAGLVAKVSAAALTCTANLSFWSVMSTTKSLTVATAAVALLAIGINLFERTTVGRLDAALTRDRDTLQARLHDAEHRAAQLDQATSNADPSGESASKPPPTSSGPAIVSGSNPATRRPPPAPAPSPEAVAQTAMALPLSRATHVAFVIDTSGSMRDPATESVRASIVERLWAIFVAYPNVQYVQILDCDGRFILGRSGEWLANQDVTRDVVVAALRRYQIFSNSNPVPGVSRAMRNLPDPENPAHQMSVVVMGDEITADIGAAITHLDLVNPADANGQRRFAVNAVQFTSHLSAQGGASAHATVAKYAEAMRRIAQEQGGAFVEAP